MGTEKNCSYATNYILFSLLAKRLCADIIIIHVKFRPYTYGVAAIERNMHLTYTALVSNALGFIAGGSTNPNAATSWGEIGSWAHTELCARALLAVVLFITYANLLFVFHFWNVFAAGASSADCQWEQVAEVEVKHFSSHSSPFGCGELCISSWDVMRKQENSQFETIIPGSLALLYSFQADFSSRTGFSHNFCIDAKVNGKNTTKIWTHAI